MPKLPTLLRYLSAHSAQKKDIESASVGLLPTDFVST